MSHTLGWQVGAGLSAGNSAGVMGPGYSPWSTWVFSENGGQVSRAKRPMKTMYCLFGLR